MANLDRNNYETNFRNSYQSASYYDKSRTWDDYSPAYDYAYQSKTGTYAGKKFEDAENDLERGWDKAKANSRLMWNDARASGPRRIRRGSARPPPQPGPRPRDMPLSARPGRASPARGWTGDGPPRPGRCQRFRGGRPA